MHQYNKLSNERSSQKIQLNRNETNYFGTYENKVMNFNLLYLKRKFKHKLA